MIALESASVKSPSRKAGIFLNGLASRNSALGVREARRLQLQLDALLAGKGENLADKRRQ